jgi:quercetin dioxygenase-like cupin family protein
MRRIVPDDLPWVSPTEGVRYKSTVRDGHKVRLLEFAPGFADADWCCTAHTGYVLDGRLEIAFAEGIEIFSAGDIIMIDEGDKHRARVIQGPVRLFLVENA